MNATDPAELTRQLFRHFSAGQVDAVLALLHDDATWRIAGKPELNPSAGAYDKARIGALFNTMMGRLRSGLDMRVTGLTVQGERVAAEVVSHGELRNGRVYNQEYHFLIEFRGARIAAVREYLDTQHAHAVWMQR